MSPLELICQDLPKYWQCRNRLRIESNDPQIFGCEYCAEGAIANIFLKNALLAKRINARWERIKIQKYASIWGFIWEENNATHIERAFLPKPVIDWINEYHGTGTGESLKYSLAYMNDKSTNFDSISLMIQLQFGLNSLNNISQKAKTAFGV